MALKRQNIFQSDHNTGQTTRRARLNSRIDLNGSGPCLIIPYLQKGIQMSVALNVF
jgi:hypothetical protein